MIGSTRSSSVGRLLIRHSPVSAHHVSATPSMVVVSAGRTTCGLSIVFHRRGVQFTHEIMLPSSPRRWCKFATTERAAETNASRYLRSRERTASLILIRPSYEWTVEVASPPAGASAPFCTRLDKPAACGLGPSGRVPIDWGVVVYAERSRTPMPHLAV